MDVEGLQLEGRYDFTEHFFGFIAYEDADVRLQNVGSIDYRAFTAGLGGYYSVADAVDFYYSAGYRYAEWDADGGFDQGIGHISASVGLRWAPVEWLEFNPSVTHYFPVKDDDFLNAVQATYLDVKLYFTVVDLFQPYVGFNYNLQENSRNLIGDLELFQVGLRMSF